MALVLKDRVKEVTSVTSTGTATLLGAVVGFQTFNTAIPTGSTVYYCIAGQGTSQWEVGVGTFTAPDQLSRDTVYSSSSAGALVNFSAGTKDVFVTYPSERAVFEETDGTTVLRQGPITVVGANASSYTSFGASLGEFYANTPGFAQLYAQNLNSSANASTDIVAYNNLGDGVNNFIDMGICSSSYTDAAFPIFSPGSGYVYNDGGVLLVGSATNNVTVFAGGVDTNNAVVTFGTDLSTSFKGNVAIPGTFTANGAAAFANTVTLSANPTLALQAATKQYVDNQVTAGLHIHEPVRVETTGNLTATYVQGGTTFNITTITSGTTVTTSANHGLNVNDQIWLYSTAGNGLTTNTAYFVYSIPALNQLTLSLTFDGAQITGLTNASGLTYATRANSGVGATLTNAGTQAALNVDSIALSSGNRVMVRLQTNGAENGVYTVTTVGNGSTNWVLTRATDSNRVDPGDPDGLGTGDYFFTQEGVINAGDSHVLTTEPNTMIIGYTPLTYTQFSGSVDYVGGTNINITGQTISLTGTVAAINGGTGANTVTTGDLLYGSATNTWSKLPIGTGYKSLVVNAGGTQVEWNAVALNQSGAVSGSLGPTNGGTGISSYTQGEMLYANSSTQLDKVTPNTTTTRKFLSQTGNGTTAQAPGWNQPDAADITGLAPSATTDTANASNITSGTLPTGRLTGSYTGITGVGTIATGAWAANAIAVSYGGTGASNTTDARTNLGLTIGTNVQAYSATLQTVANLSSNGLLNRSAANTVTIASAADIVSQIGSTAVTNATNATTATNQSGGTVAATSITGTTIAINGNGGGNDPYGTIAITEPANANNYSYYGLTRAGQVGLGIGISGTNGAGGLGANAFWMGGATAGTAGVLSGTAWIAFNSSSFVAAGNVTAYSDERLKKDWSSVGSDFVERLAEVKSGTYTRIDTGERQAGASAQAMKELLPEVVVGKDTLSLAYGNAALVAAIELAKQVVELKKEIELLKAR
jgi:hypothetical protein